jgi:hypothetical protein
MNDEERLDHWRDRMVAALYGELEPAAKRELEEALAGDDALRRDWEELQQARVALRELAGREGREVEAPAHRSALLWSPPVQRGARRWLLAGGVGFAAAAVLFLGLLVAGLRVDRTPAGLLVRLDGSPAAELEAATAMAPAAGQRGVTRAEFAEVAQALFDGTTARLDELERRQTGAQVELTQALYDALAVRQERQFDDLRNRIELARANGPWSAGDRHLPAPRKGENDGTD